MTQPFQPGWREGGREGTAPVRQDGHGDAPSDTRDCAHVINAHVAADHRVRVDGHVLAELDARLDPRRCRIDDRHAGEHVRLVDAVAELPGDEGELDARVDPLHLPRDGSDVHRHRLAVLHEQADVSVT